MHDMETANMRYAWYVTTQGIVFGFGDTSDEAVAQANSALGPGDARIDADTIPRVAGSASSAELVGRKLMTDQGEAIWANFWLLYAKTARDLGIEDAGNINPACAGNTVVMKKRPLQTTKEFAQTDNGCAHGEVLRLRSPDRGRPGSFWITVQLENIRDVSFWCVPPVLPAVE